MHTLRQTGGLAGFTNRSESDHDPFGAGHSSTSISAGLGEGEGEGAGEGRGGRGGGTLGHQEGMKESRKEGQMTSECDLTSKPLFFSPYPESRTLTVTLLC